MDERIKQLLKLQQKHSVLIAAEAELARFPAALASFAAQKAEAQGIFETEKAELAAMNSKRSQMRLERRALEDRKNKCKVRLAEVRKNDEYALLSSEVDRLSSQISDMEDAELQLLMDIDKKTELVGIAKSEYESRLAEISKKEAECAAIKPSLEQAVNLAKAEFEDAKSLADPAFAAAYFSLYSGGKKLPIVVPLEGGICGGCFLKNSSTTSDLIRNAASGPVFCEQCGRILYV